MNFFNLCSYDYNDTSTNQKYIECIKNVVRRSIENDLTERQRQICILYHFEGMNMNEIANQLNVNQSTVSRTLKRAMAKLKTRAGYVDEVIDMKLKSIAD